MSYRNNNVKLVATMLLSLALLVILAPNHMTPANPPAPALHKNPELHKKS